MSETLATRSDTTRDVERYHNLLLAMQSATRRIKEMSEMGDDHLPVIDDVLSSLLPDLALALNAQHAFAAVPSEQPPRFKLTVAYPQDKLKGRQFTAPELWQLIESGRTKVIEPLEDEPRNPIPGLELFDAASAVLVILRSADEVRMVGMCNRAPPETGPYLAADRMILESVVELIATGVRTGEQRRRELETIQRITKAISAELDLNKLLPMITQGAAEVFNAPASSLMLWTENRDSLVIRANYGLSEAYAQGQVISGLLTDEMAKWIRTPGPVYWRDLQEAPIGNERLIKEEHLRTVLIVPLAKPDKLLGVLNIYSKGEPRLFSTLEQDLAQVFADHAAIAIQNANLFEEERRRANELATLSDVSATVNVSLNPKRVLETIADSVIQVFECQHLAIYLFDEEQQSLRLETSRGLSEQFRKESESLTIAPATRAAQILMGERGLYQRDIQDDVLFAAERTLARHEGYQYCVDVPMKVRGKPIGLINVYYDKPHTLFRRREMNLLLVFANQAAIAVQNANLHEASVQQSRHWQALYQASKAITAGFTERKRVLDQILERAVKVTGLEGPKARWGTIQLYEPATNELSVESAYPLQMLPLLKDRLGERRFLDKSKGPIGISGRAVLEKKPQWVKDVDSDPDYLEADGKTKAEIDVPLLDGSRVVGVLTVKGDQANTFNQRDSEVLTGLAEMAVIAIKNAESYEALRRSAERLLALNKASHAIAHAGLEIESVVQTILEQAVEVTGAHFGTLQLVAEDDHLEFMAAWPRERLEWLRQNIGPMSVHGPGITARAVRENCAQLVRDVRQDSDFVDAMGGETGSELAVVFREGGETGAPIGVLNVEHRVPDGLGENDRELLTTLANLAVTALSNVKRAEQLTSINAVAIMGAWGADIVHDINREVGNIRRNIFLLKESCDLSSAEVRKYLETIDKAAGNLALPVLPDRAPEPGSAVEIHTTHLDEIVSEEAKQLQYAHPHIEFQVECNCPGVWVAMHEQWIQRLLRHLAKNAARIMPPEWEPRQMTIRTMRLNDKMAEVQVEDTGRGIRPQIRARLFKRPIDHVDERQYIRAGRGLLLVRYVAEQYGGQVRLVHSEEGKGACFGFSIPISPPPES